MSRVSRPASCSLRLPARRPTPRASTSPTGRATVDWLQVGDDGYTFMFAKATEGTTFTDITYSVNRAGASGVGHATRRVPLRAARRRRRRRDRRERDRAGRPLRRRRAAEGWRPAARARPGGERRACPPRAREVDAGMGRRGHRAHRSPRAHLRRRRASGRPRSATRPSFAGTGASRSGSRTGRRSAAPLVPASNWNGLGWTFWQWSSCSRGAGLRKLRRRRPAATPTVDAARDQGRIRAARRRPARRRRSSARPGPASRLAGVPGTWSGGKPVAFSYQWQSCDAAGAGCSPIAGATLETYTPDDRRRRPRAVARGHAQSPRGAARSRRRRRRSPSHRPGSGTATAPRSMTAPAGRRRRAGRTDAHRRRRHLDAARRRHLRSSGAGATRGGAACVADRRRDRLVVRRSRRATSARRSRSSSPRPAKAARRTAGAPTTAVDRRRARAGGGRRLRSSRRPAPRARSSRRRPRHRDLAAGRGARRHVGVARRRRDRARDRRQRASRSPSRRRRRSCRGRSTSRTPSAPRRTVVGFSTDGKIWLAHHDRSRRRRSQGTVLQGTYDAAGVAARADATGGSDRALPARPLGRPAEDLAAGRRSSADDGRSPSTGSATARFSSSHDSRRARSRTSTRRCCRQRASPRRS